ncbi:thioredoxin domain-containing protein [Candidatus Saccharibacteria bacterium]|nr:thioredoxin domain-containing protein [Candidatus Saccharibacteria bacterium]
MAEESIFAKKPKAEKPASVLDQPKAEKPASVLDQPKATKAPKKVASVLDQPAPAAPAKAAAPAAPAAKSGSKAGLIVTIIILAAALIAVGVVLTVILVSQNNKSDKKDDPISLNTPKDEPKDEPKDDPKQPSSDDNPTIVAGDHVRGKRDSKVAVVEYADPQCPGCASMMPVMEEIYKEYGDQVAFIYRHYPLSYHKHAEDAIKAIEAAGEQGYFWEMLSAVFDNQIDWEYEDDADELLDAFVEIFEDAAEDGDATAFRKAYNDNDYSDKIAADKKLGANDNLSATPTIIVNGKTIKLSGTYASIKQSIIDEIKANL